MIVLDTHALVWLTVDERRLGRKARQLIDRNWSVGRVGAASVSFWEAAYLSECGRIRLNASAKEWRARLLGDGLVEVPLDGAMALRAADLRGASDDPIDRFIVATALESGAALMTADERLLRWGHALTRHDASL